MNCRIFRTVRRRGPGPLRWAALLLALLFLPALPCAAAEQGVRTVRVGIFPFDGYYAADAAGDRSGYGYELLQMLGQHANFDYAYVDDVPQWSEMEQMLLDGRLDLLTCVQKTPENEARFAFSTQPIGTSYTMMTVRAGNTAVTAGAYDSYAGLRVGVLRGNAHAQKFAAFAQQQGFAYVQAEYDSLDALKAALQSGAVDAAVTSSLRPLRGEWIVEQFDPSPYYLMMRRDDAGLLQMMDQAIQQLDVSAPNWRTELYDRYYTPDSGSSLQLSAAERAYIAAQRQTVFRAAVCPDNAPYSYWDNGEAKGILPEIFAEIAARAGIRCEIVRADSHAAYQAQLDGGVDLVIDSGWDYSDAEKAGYKLTSSYISLPIAQVTRLGDSGQIKTAAVAQGAVWDELTKHPPAQQYTLRQYPSASATIQAVLAGECDAALVYSADAQNYAANDLRSRLRVSQLPGAEVQISVASAQKNDYLLLSVLSKSAQSVRGDFVSETVLKYTVDMVPHIGLVDYLYLNPVWFVLAAVLFSLLAFAAVVIFYQRSWNERQKRLTAQMMAAKQEAENANAAKSEFLSSVSHDLRTPLNGILGFTRAALRAQQPQERLTYLQKIQSSGELLLDLVNDTLELSRIESGKLVAQPERTDGRAMLEAVVNAVRPTAEHKGVRLVTAFDASADTPLLADRKKIQKVALNLLANAVRYTPQGGTVTLSAGTADGALRFAVADTGIGMSEEFLHRLYEPFVQERRPGQENAGGTGLGLAIVKRTVDFLGGSISVESRLDAGSTFRVTLPAAAAPPADPKAPPARAAVLAGRRVLLCEDNAVNTEIAMLLLDDLGLAADCAADGAQGVQRFAQSAPGFYAAVLMDVRMPVMDGLAAARAIRALDRPDAASVPIIAMTADAFADDIQRCLDAGMNAHIAKPVDPARLRAVLEEKL